MLKFSTATKFAFNYEIFSYPDITISWHYIPTISAFTKN